MADERDAQFPRQLKKLGADDLRRQFDPSIRPVPMLRTIAVTELEKRRQKQANVLSRPKFSLGMVVLGAIVAAIAVWIGWAIYIA